MYQQWNQVMTVLQASFESLNEPGEDTFFEKEQIEDQIQMLLGDAYEVAAKIRSSEARLHIIRMENAAIIRKKAQFIKISTINFMLNGLMKEDHRQIIRGEIDIFSELFKQWVVSFEKDDCEVEWGLF